MIETKLSQAVVAAVKSLYGLEVEESAVQLQKTRSEFEGDITLLTFPFVKAARKAPEQVSAEIGVQLTRDRRIPSRKAHMAIKNAYLSAFVDYTVFSTRHIMPLTAGVKLSCLLQVKKYKCIYKLLKKMMIE